MLDFLAKRARWIMAAFALMVFLFAQTGWFQKHSYISQTTGLFRESNLLQKLEGVLIDFRYRARGTRLPNSNVILVGVQSSSFNLSALSPEEIAASEALQLMKNPWPWDRKVFALLIEKLMSAGAKVVVLDVVFAAETSSDPVLAETLKRHPDQVVIGSAFLNVESEGTTVQQYVEPNPSLLFENHNIVGYVTSLTEPGEVIIRRGRYRTSQLREFNSSLAIATKEPDNLMSISALAVEKFAGRVATPPYDHSNFIDFAGPQGTYHVIPVEQLFVEKLWNAKQMEGGAVFKDKIVLVGPFAEILHDVHETPWGTMPGPEILANMMSTLLRNSSLPDSSAAFNFGSTLTLTLIALVISMFIQNALTKAFLLAGTVAGFFGVSQFVFSTGDRTIIPMVAPLFCLITTGTFGVAFQYWLEQLERVRIRSVLERYVSKNVAKEILSDPRSFVESLQGRKQRVTVLFSDIRGFTGMTEGADAEKLVAQLNEYFQEMVGIVYEEEGAVQKFIGDAIMAAWGDTHSKGLAEDAAGAIRAALRMRPALEKLNAQWAKSKDRAQLKIGLGINHGEVVVGNIGHPQRMEFTVLGDGVNLAARLESATKQFNTDILVGEEAEKLTRDLFIFRKVGTIAFKGKTRPIEVYILLNDKSQPAPPWLNEYHEAIQLYRARSFAAAGTKFEAVQKAIGEEDYLCQMYLQRCAACLTIPPPDNWDGSFALTEK